MKNYKLKWPQWLIAISVVLAGASSFVYAVIMEHHEVLPLAMAMSLAGLYLAFGKQPPRDIL